MTERAESNRPRDTLKWRAIYALAAVGMVAVGVAVLVYLYRTRPRPEAKPDKVPAPLVRVFEAVRTSHLVAVTALGTSRSDEQWTAIAEVRGEAIEVNPRFEEGEIFPRSEPGENGPVGTWLVKIDTELYDLAVQTRQAEVETHVEQLKELQATGVNLRQIRDLQQKQLNLSRRHVERQMKLMRERAVSEGSVETAQDAELARLTALQRTVNSLALISVQQARLEASRRASVAQLKLAQRELAKCVIRLPYDPDDMPAPKSVRCVSKSVEQNQVVSPGERLGTFLSLDKAEVVAMVEIRQMQNLFPEGIKQLGVLDLGKMEHRQPLLKLVQIPVKVTWALGQPRPIWWGRVTRIASSLDPGTRSVPVIVEVPKPYENVQPGVRPPLVPNVFCEVTVYGATLEDVVVIPRDALREVPREVVNGDADDPSRVDCVYLVRDGELHIARVKIKAREEELVAVGAGIEQGDLVILSDLPLVDADLPLVSQGMPLRYKRVDNPVKPRRAADVGYPADLFAEDADPPAAPSEQETTP